jgi:cytochrome c
MKKMIICWFVLALVGLLPLLVSAGEDEIGKTATELVDLAVAKFQEKGKDYTIKLLNTFHGPLRKGELYVFSFDFDGTNLSHPIREDIRGKSWWDMKDANGKLFVQDFVRIAKNDGQGWTEYMWQKPGDEKPTLKRSFIKRIPGENILIGVGYHTK